MARWRRRGTGPATEAFERVVAEVERGKQALVRAVPSPRGVPGPLAEAVLAFEDSMRRARAHLAAWPRPVGATWEQCAEALDESARRAERLRLDAPALDYEGLVTVLGDLMAPLDVFEEAALTFRR